MTYTAWTLDKEEMERFASGAMCSTIAHLIKDEIITPEQASKWVDSHTMTVLTKNSVMDNIARLLGLVEKGKGSSLQFRVVELDLPK